MEGRFWRGAIRIGIHPPPAPFRPLRLGSDSSTSESAPPDGIPAWRNPLAEKEKSTLFSLHGSRDAKSVTSLSLHISRDAEAFRCIFHAMRPSAHSRRAARRHQSVDGAL